MADLYFILIFLNLIPKFNNIIIFLIFYYLINSLMKFEIILIEKILFIIYNYIFIYAQNKTYTNLEVNNKWY